MLFDPFIDYLEFERSIATKIFVCSDIAHDRLRTEEEGKKKKKNKENKEMEKKKKMGVFLFICFIDK